MILENLVAQDDARKTNSNTVTILPIEVGEIRYKRAIYKGFL